MAKNMNLTMAGLRLAEEKMKQEQKPLSALEELRQEQAWMRATQTQKEQKPLTAITVALEGKEKEHQSQNLRLKMQEMQQEKRRQSEIWAKPAIFDPRASRQIPISQIDWKSRLDNSGRTEENPAHRILGSMPDWAWESRVDFMPGVSAMGNELGQTARNTIFRKDQLEGRNVTKGQADIHKFAAKESSEQSYGFGGVADPSSIIPPPPEQERAIPVYTPPLTILQEQQTALMDELIALQSEANQVLPQFPYANNLDMDEYWIYFNKQIEILNRLGDIREKIADESAKNPLYSGKADLTNFNFYQIAASVISGLYSNIWYNTNGGHDEAFLPLYPILYKLSLVNGDISNHVISTKRLFGLKANEMDKKILSAFKKGEIANQAFKDGFIINQRELVMKDDEVSYGVGTSPANGCGWISAYNALKILGKDPDPYYVMRDLEDGAFALGTVGTDPLYIQRYFRSLGYDADIYFAKEDMEREAYKADATILVYGYLSNGMIGGHFIAGYPEGDSGEMTFFNDSEPISTNPLEKYYHDYDIFRFAICISKP